MNCGRSEHPALASLTFSGISATASHVGGMAPLKQSVEEPWRSKREIAAFYSVSLRWIEARLGEGMPSRLIGGQRRLRLSEVDVWLWHRSAG